MPKKFPGTDKHCLGCQAMLGENRQLVTNEPVEFEKLPVEVQICRKITDQFLGIYRIYHNLMKETGGCEHVTGWTCKH